MSDKRDPLDDQDVDSRLVSVIRTRRRVGDGTVDSPNRVVTTYHGEDGELIAVQDLAQDEPSHVTLLREALEEALDKILVLLDEHPNDDQIHNLRERVTLLRRVQVLR